MFTARNVVIAVIAGIVGTIANSIAIGVVLGAPVMPLIFSFGREVVAILVALLLVPIFARMSGGAAWATALVALTIIPSLLAKLVFAAGAGWGMVLFLNLIYALAATAVYVAGRRNSGGGAAL